MILRGFIAALIFGIAVFALILGFDAVATVLRAAGGIIDYVGQQITGSSVFDWSYYDYASSQLGAILPILVAVGFVAVFLIYGVHTKRR